MIIFKTTKNQAKLIPNFSQKNFSLLLSYLQFFFLAHKLLYSICIKSYKGQPKYDQIRTNASNCLKFKMSQIFHLLPYGLVYWAWGKQQQRSFELHKVHRLDPLRPKGWATRIIWLTWNNFQQWWKKKIKSIIQIIFPSSSQCNWNFNWALTDSNHSHEIYSTMLLELSLNPYKQAIKK